MKTLIKFSLVLLVFLSGCGKAPIDAATSDFQTALISSDTQDSSTQPATCSDLHMVDLGVSGCISVTPLTVKTQAQALAACVATQQTLCTYPQMFAANQQGHVDYAVARPETYWFLVDANAPLISPHTPANSQLYGVTYGPASGVSEKNDVRNANSAYCCAPQPQ